MNPNKPRVKILFLCTGNSARSIFAEYQLKAIAPARFETYSAGASPKPAPHPLALEVLREDFKIEASDAYSKSWEEFNDAQFDFVITLCDSAGRTALSGPDSRLSPTGVLRIRRPWQVRKPKSDALSGKWPNK
jgi:protein-tyrosine-phosphatase